MFLTWEWLVTWWQIFGAGRSLRLVTLRDPGGTLVAIAPFALREARRAGVRTRVLELLGTNEPPADAIWSERIDMFALPSYEHAAVTAIAHHLVTRMRDEWDEIHFTNTLEGALAGRVARALSDAGRRVTATARTSALAVELPAHASAVPHLLGARTRRKLGAYRRALDTRGGLTAVTCAAADEVRPALDRLVALHQRRWTAGGQPGVFASEAFATFHRTVAPRLFDMDALQLVTVSVADRPVASVYGFRHAGTASAYQSGFDVAFAPTISLGLVTFAACMEDAVRCHCREWDFLRGLEPYKSWWPCVERRYEDTRAWNSGHRAAASWAAFQAGHAARRVVRRTRQLLSNRRAEDPR